jgi:hypothetical protein
MKIINTVMMDLGVNKVYHERHVSYRSRSFLREGNVLIVSFERDCGRERIRRGGEGLPIPFLIMSISLAPDLDKDFDP